MQTENLTNNNHKQFDVILNTDQIKLYTYSDLLEENNLNLKPYKQATCIPFWNDVKTETSTSMSLQREIHVVCL